MIFTLFALAAALALACVLWMLVRPEPPSMLLLEDPSARLLPSRDIVFALFDDRDREFVARQNSAELMQLLENQRRSLALLWLGAVRREALAAIHDYRLSMRQAVTVRVGEELRMIYRMASFLALHLVLSVAVRTTSVFRVQGMLKKFHGLSGLLLEYALPQGGGVTAV